MSKLYYADCQINVRVYFEDDGENDLNDQAMDALIDRSMIPDDAGDIEHNGTQIICVEARHD